jgi:hypothetical protein
MGVGYGEMRWRRGAHLHQSTAATPAVNRAVGRRDGGKGGGVGRTTTRKLVQGEDAGDETDDEHVGGRVQRRTRHLPHAPHNHARRAERG